MNLSKTMQTIIDVAILVGFKVIGAIVFYLIGRWLISFAIRLVTDGSGAAARSIPTLLRYIGTVISVTLNVILVVAILGYFGVETTSFAAILAAAGRRHRHGMERLVGQFRRRRVCDRAPRPFKVGDFVTAAGVTGTVKEIGLFVHRGRSRRTTCMTMLGNNKIFSDTIQNFSANPFRRVDLKAQLAHCGGPQRSDQTAEGTGRARCANIDGRPRRRMWRLLEFNFDGPVLAVRPYCHTDNYWQVYFDTNKVIRETCGAAGYPVPEQHFVVRNPT